MSRDNEHDGKPDGGGGDRVTKLSPERRRLLEALLAKERAASGDPAVAGASKPSSTSESDSDVGEHAGFRPPFFRQPVFSPLSFTPPGFPPPGFSPPGVTPPTGSLSQPNPVAPGFSPAGFPPPLVPPVGFPTPPGVSGFGGGAGGQPPHFMGFATGGFRSDPGSPEFGQPSPWSTPEKDARGKEPESSAQTDESSAHKDETRRYKATGQQSKILIAMKSSGRLPPFFCVHAAFGSVFPYHRLAMHLDDEQPFFGLQAPGLDGECPPLEHIDAMADLYIESVKSLQPEGPYFLGGYSFGGWVAYEMACKLVENGDKVGLLAVFGTSVPVSVADPKIAEEFDFWLDYIEHYRRLVLNSYLSDEHRMRGATFATRDDHSALSPLAKVVQATERAQVRYVPRPYPGMLHLYLTIEQQRAFPFDHSMGWNQLCGEKVATYLVSGNHLSMFHEPHVNDLATQLTGSLRRVHGVA